MNFSNLREGSPQFVKKLLTPKFLKFLVVGGISTAINYGTFYFLLTFLKIPYVISSGIGYVTGLIIGYFLNKSRSFQHYDSHSAKLIGKYFTVYGSTLILGLLLIFGLVEGAGMSPLLAQLFSLIVTTLSNYYLLKTFVFKK